MIKKKTSKEIQEERINKLPAWARELIHDLELHHSLAVRALNDFCDNQKPSSIKHTEIVCDVSPPTHRTCFIQSNRITFILEDGNEIDAKIEGNHLSLTGPNISISPIASNSAEIRVRERY